MRGNMNVKFLRSLYLHFTHFFVAKNASHFSIRYLSPAGVVKVPELVVDHSHPSSYKVTNEWSYTSTLPTYFLGVNRTFAIHTTLTAKLCLVRVF